MDSAEKYFCSLAASSLEAAGVWVVFWLWFLKVEAVVYFLEKPGSASSDGGAT